MKISLSTIEAAFKAEVKTLAAKFVTAAIAAAWSAIGNPTGEAVLLTDANALALAVASHLGVIGAALVSVGEGELDTVIKAALTELGATATEATVTAYVLKHLGLS